MSDEAETVARCAECGAKAEKGGPIEPDEAMVRARWVWCAYDREAGKWTWCYTWKRFKRR